MAARTIAVDWSGRKTGERSAIRAAQAREGMLIRLDGGFSRPEAIEYLSAELESDPELFVGLDFSFSLPAWFLRERGLSSGEELWSVAADEGESWLSACEPPFWGRAGRKRPEASALRPQMRATDEATAAAAVPRPLVPRSPFQVSGAGSVGASSIRGMPFLDVLRAAGFNIWPWDDARAPAVVEIWTRMAIGSTVKSSASARERAVAQHSGIPSGLEAAAAESEDTFDAAMTALWMSSHIGALDGAPASTAPLDRLEGRTWLPPDAVSTSR